MNRSYRRARRQIFKQAFAEVSEKALSAWRVKGSGKCLKKQQVGLLKEILCDLRELFV